MRVNNVLLNNAKRAGYLTKVEVVSQQAAADTDYQVKVEDVISRKGDGEDITFFQKNSILHHWLESYASWQSDAWAKLPKLPITKSQILNVLSGNPSTSNYDNTFIPAHVYVGGGITRTVQKLDKSDLTNIVDESANYGGTIRALAEDADYVYVAGSGTQTVRKLDKSDLTNIVDESANYGGTIYVLGGEELYRKYVSPEPLIIKRKISGKAGIIKNVCGGICS